VKKLDWTIKIMFFKKTLTSQQIFFDQMDENPLRCTTKDEKGLVLPAILFYPIF